MQVLKILILMNFLTLSGIRLHPLEKAQKGSKGGQGLRRHQCHRLLRGGETTHCLEWGVYETQCSWGFKVANELLAALFRKGPVCL